MDKIIKIELMFMRNGERAVSKNTGIVFLLRVQLALPLGGFHV